MAAVIQGERALSDDGKECRSRFKAGLLLRMIFSCLIDADRTDTANFENPDHARLRSNGHYPPWDILIGRLEKHLHTFKHRHPVDGIRARLSAECLGASGRSKGIFTLTVPTGGGKTLASLRFALHHARKWQHDRIIYVVPYTTIIDQNAQETRDVLEPSGTLGGFASVVLEHHSNLTPEEETLKSKLLSENWDAPVIYTTMVQLLESLFSAGTRSVRRMHQLANAVIVFDEIQALPVNTVHLFCNALDFLTRHCDSTVVLCTATQPLLHRVDSAKGALTLSAQSELISDVKSLFRDLKRVQIRDRRKTGGWSDEEIAALAEDGVRESGSCLVIVNTKDAARSLYDLCKRRNGRDALCHLSTNMCPAHRMDVVDEVWRRLGKRGEAPTHPGSVLCISTQLIEAGVDVECRLWDSKCRNRH